MTKAIAEADIARERRDSYQDICINEIREKQNGVLKTLEDLKKKH